MVAQENCASKYLRLLLSSHFLPPRFCRKPGIFGGSGQHLFFVLPPVTPPCSCVAPPTVSSRVGASPPPINLRDPVQNGYKMRRRLAKKMCEAYGELTKCSKYSSEGPKCAIQRLLQPSKCPKLACSAAHFEKPKRPTLRRQVYLPLPRTSTCEHGHLSARTTQQKKNSAK